MRYAPKSQISIKVLEFRNDKSFRSLTKESYAEAHQVWLEKLLKLKNGVPHADTYRQVFALIDPESVQSCFLSWIRQVVTKTEGEVIAINGKQLTGSYDHNQKKVSTSHG